MKINNACELLLMTNNQQIKLIFSLVVLSIFSFFSSAEETRPIMEVRYNQNTLYSSKDVDDYYGLLLRLSLEETREEYGDYKLIPQRIKMVQQRSILMLQKNALVDVIWTMTSLERENKLQAVYFPLLKGLLGYRLFLIRKGEQEKFNHINTADDLTKIPFGQGVNWPDTEILISNNFNVIKALGDNLHDMLENKRFDLFPRSILEITNESNSRPNLTIESNILLKYPAPLYFFVNKQNKVLAERLNLGLSKLLVNGKFDDIFYSNKGPSTQMKVLHIDKRKVITINNPNLSDESQKLLSNAKLWFL